VRRRAGRFDVRSLSRLDSLKIDSKGRNDFVTDIDARRSDIIATIRRSHPRTRFLAEEGGAPARASSLDHRSVGWNHEFPAGFPTFAVSIALEHRAPAARRRIRSHASKFFTPRAATARNSRQKIRVSTQRTLEGALIGTGFPFRAAHVDEYLAMLKVIMSAAAGVRRPGAASLDLAYVARTHRRLLGIRPVPWDTAAGHC